MNKETIRELREKADEMVSAGTLMVGCEWCWLCKGLDTLDRK